MLRSLYTPTTPGIMGCHGFDIHVACEVMHLWVEYDNDEAGCDV